MGTRLRGANILLSAAIPSDAQRSQRLTRRDSHIHVHEAVLSLARAIFSESGTIVFSGPKSMAQLLAMVASEYVSPRHAEEDRPIPRHFEDTPRFRHAPLRLFQSAAYRDVLPDESWLMHSLGFAQIDWVPAVDGEHFDPVDPQRQCVRSLAQRRRVMFAEMRPVAMVAIGGREEEAQDVDYFLNLVERSSAPLYAITETGGVAAQLSDLPQHRNRVRLFDEEIVTRFAALPLSSEETGAEWDRTWARTSEDMAPPIISPRVPYGLVMQLLAEDIANRFRLRDR